MREKFDRHVRTGSILIVILITTEGVAGVLEIL